MTLKIYGAARSRAFRVLWAAEELGLAYEHVPIPFADANADPAYRAINPNGRIPAIDDDGFVLFESLAITQYLFRRHGGPLQPVGLQDEARLAQWSLWGANEIELPLITLVQHTRLFPDDRRDARLADEAAAKLPRPLAVLDAHLAGRAFLLGDGFTVADLNVSSLLYTAWLNRIDLARWPHVVRWLDEALTRPAALRARKLREP